MSKLISIGQSMGAGRANHAAAIAMASNAWKEYAETHESTFATNGLNKYVIVDGAGKVLARNSKSAELVNNALYNNNTLRHEDFLTIQSMVVEIRRRKLNGVADLFAAGLSFPVSISDQIVGAENINGFDDAQQDQNPTSFDDNDTVYNETYVPNPITHKTFSVPFRQEGFAYKSSAALKESIRKVAERLEETLFNGNDKIKINFGGSLQAIYGYTNHPDRGTATISDWSLPANNDAIVPECIAAINQMFGQQGGVEMDSVVLYFPKNFKGAMDRDYSTLKGDNTVAQRIMAIPEIKEVKFAENLADDNVVFVEMMERTVQMAVASDIISVPHIKTNPLQAQTMTTYAAMVPIIHADSESNTGILHCTV